MKNSTKILTHYSIKPFKLDDFYNVDQDDVTVGKPNGLWLSDDSDLGWKKWCKLEDFCVDRLKYKTDLKVDLTKILHIKNSKELLEFSDTYYKKTHWMDTINWKMVADRYKGILISPYIHSQRLSVSWYYGWDVASACIWNKEAFVT